MGQGHLEMCWGGVCESGIHFCYNLGEITEVEKNVVIITGLLLFFWFRYIYCDTFITLLSSIRFVV